ncbi:hypothetical protein O0L34_g17134 [Tuta absoluta]|nr:hypothetical protein O0L34_g17134 [Tuta absoluta]
MLGEIMGEDRIEEFCCTEVVVIVEERLAELSEVDVMRAESMLEEGRVEEEEGFLGRSCTKAPLPQRACEGGAWLCASPDATSLPEDSRTRARHPMCFEEQ